jgi:hypothetical protein
MVTISSIGNGTTDPTGIIIISSFALDLTVTALPNKGYKLSYWLVDGDMNGAEPILKITKPSQRLGTVKAVFGLIDSWAINCSWCGKVSPQPEIQYRGNLTLCEVCASFTTKEAMELAKSYIITVANIPELSDQNKQGWLGY